MDINIYKNYLAILREEMIPAMGSSDLIALAYGAARAREILGKEPERIVAKCSGNIIKNVRCVIIPNSGGLKGIPAGVILGAVAGDASLDMEVLSKVDEKGRARCRELLEADICKSFWIRRWSFTLSSKCMPVKIPSAWRSNTTIST